MVLLVFGVPKCWVLVHRPSVWYSIFDPWINIGLLSNALFLISSTFFISLRFLEADLYLCPVVEYLYENDRLVLLSGDLIVEFLILWPDLSNEFYFWNCLPDFLRELFSRLSELESWSFYLFSIKLTLGLCFL